MTSLSKALGHLLSDKVANKTAKPLANGQEYTVSKSDFAPGSVGRFDLTPDQTTGGGPFSRTMSQNGKELPAITGAVGGALVSCTIGETIGNLPNLDHGDLAFKLNTAQHPGKYAGNYDGK